VGSSCICCFNGAAACWRRKETIITTGNAIVALASMGPPLVGGGKELVSGMGVGLRKGLQWGRRLLAAESVQSDIRSALSTLQLQWGRRLLAAEILLEEHQRVFLRVASMGPPLVGGGNGMKLKDFRTILATLQGGRRLLAAEMLQAAGIKVELTPASMGPPLVGGGNQVEAVAEARVPLNASMGPPLVGGGNHRDSDGGGCALRLQWGRRLLAAEIIRNALPRSGSLE